MCSDLADDRTTKARIRDAAIDCYGRLGVAATTARKVAEAAEVSPGSVMFHFESMDGLRQACDQHVAATVRRRESDMIRSGAAIDPSVVWAEYGPVGAYLARVLHDDSPTVAQLVDDLVADAETYLEGGVEAGTVKPSENPHGRAVALTLFSLGSLALHTHVKRLLGVDLTDSNADPNAAAPFVGPVLELFTDGLSTEAPDADSTSHQPSSHDETSTKEQP